MITVLCDLSVLRISGSSDAGVTDLVDMMTMAVVTMAVVTMAVVTMAVVTMAVVTMAVVTMAVVTMAVKRRLDREQKVVEMPPSKQVVSVDSGRIQMVVGTIGLW